MTIKERAIVLNYIKYSETSIIVRLFTESRGLQSFMVNGIRNKKTKQAIGNYQPLNLIEFEGYFQSNKSIHRLNDAKVSVPFKSIYQDFKKSTIILFLSEVLGKVLVHEPESNATLFHFVWDSIVEFDQMTDQSENFHIHFLIKLAAYLGFAIESPEDLAEFPNFPHLTNQIVTSFLNASYQDYIELSSSNRIIILELLIQFYRHHIHPMSEIKSLKILHQILH